MADQQYQYEEETYEEEEQFDLEEFVDENVDEVFEETAA